MWEDKLIDELDDAKKTVHMNTYYKFYSDSLGKEVNVKNSFWYNLYKYSDSISKNKLGNMNVEESLKTLYSIKNSNLFFKFAVFLKQTFHSHKFLTNFFLQCVTINFNQHRDIFVS